jgi:hypothetical protein
MRIRNDEYGLDELGGRSRFKMKAYSESDAVMGAVLTGGVGSRCLKPYNGLGEGILSRRSRMSE